MKKNRVATLGLTAGLLAGGAAGLTLVTPALASADDTTTSESPARPKPGDRKPRFGDQGQWVKDALAPLVEAGTITQDQADAVVDAFQEARPTRHGSPFGEGANRKAGMAAKLGMTSEELRAALEDGQTLAEIAESQGIDPAQLPQAGNHRPAGMEPGFGGFRGNRGEHGPPDGFPWARPGASDGGEEAPPAA